MILNNVVPSKLHNELIKAGFNCTISHNLEDGRYFVGTCEIKFAEGTNLQLAQQVIDTHIATPMQEPKSDKERIAELENAVLFLMDINLI